MDPTQRHRPHHTDKGGVLKPSAPPGLPCCGKQARRGTPPKLPTTAEPSPLGPTRRWLGAAENNARCAMHPGTHHQKQTPFRSFPARVRSPTKQDLVTARWKRRTCRPNAKCHRVSWPWTVSLGRPPGQCGVHAVHLPRSGSDLQAVCMAGSARSPHGAPLSWHGPQAGAACA